MTRGPLLKLWVSGVSKIRVAASTGSTGMVLVKAEGWGQVGPMMCKGFRFGGARGYEGLRVGEQGSGQDDPAVIILSVRGARCGALDGPDAQSTVLGGAESTGHAGFGLLFGVRYRETTLGGGRSGVECRGQVRGKVVDGPVVSARRDRRPAGRGQEATGRVV